VELAKVYEETFPDAFGGHRRIEAMAVDAGDGGRSNQVYAWTRELYRAHAIKGQSGWTTPAIGAPTKVDITLAGKRRKRGATLWPVGTWSLKGDHYAMLRKPGMRSGADFDPPGYCHFGDFLDANYFKQITAEYLSDETFRGRPRKVWKLGREDNHLLDCRVYAMAMAEKLGLTRRTPERWVEIGRALGVPDQFSDPELISVPEDERAEAPLRVLPQKKPQGRRVRRSEWMNR
jgi:phage terminase large subunit GpA-like protein